MLKCLYVFLFLFFASLPLRAQSNPKAAAVADKKAIEAAVQTLFDGMWTSDSTKARSVMAPNLRIIIVGQNKEVVKITRETSGKQFLSMLASQPPKTLDERAWNGQLQVDGDLASYWCEYAFFNAGKFSHCGVDVFQLYRSPQGWKIVNLAYNMRRDNCDMQAIPPR